MIHSLIPKEKEIIEGITSSPITKNMEVGGKWKKAIHPFERKKLDEINKCSPIAKEKEKVGKKIINCLPSLFFSLPLSHKVDKHLNKFVKGKG